jgi:ATP-dependent helicase/DNAse subunit B
MNPLSLMQYANEMIAYETESYNRKIFSQQEKTNNAIALTFDKSFNYETLNVQITGFYDFTAEEYLIRPQITWKINDILSTSAGAFYMNGKDKSIFSYSKPVMNGIFLSLKAKI